MSRTKDFDAFFAETAKEPISFTLFGEDHVLPVSLPAIVILKIMRMQKEQGPDATISDTIMFDMAVSILGQDLLDHLCSKGLTVDQMTELIKWAMAQYRGGPDEASESGKKAQ